MNRTQKHLAALSALVLTGALAASAAPAATVIVDAKSDIFLAGQSSVPTNFPFHVDPTGGAGLLPPALGVHAGETLTFSATGTVSCCLGGAPTSGPDGGPAGFGPSSIPGFGNVGSYSGVAFPLVGVFGGPSLTTPWSIFVIGSSDTVAVPIGATKLYLGLPDALGFGAVPGYYDDNTGSFSVQVAGVPEPASWAMMLIGFGGLGAAMRGARRKQGVVA